MAGSEGIMEHGRQTIGATRSQPCLGRTLSIKALVRSLPRISLAMLICIVILAGCTKEPVQVGSPRVGPDVELANGDWGEPDYSKGYSELAGGRHLFIEMKLKGPYVGAMLSITTTTLSGNAREWRDENLEQLKDPHVSANRKNITAIKSPRKVGKRNAYGYSYYENDFKRWSQMWFVDCFDGYVCEVNLESPIDSKRFEPKLANVLNEIRWTTKTVYG